MEGSSATAYRAGVLDNFYNPYEGEEYIATSTQTTYPIQLLSLIRKMSSPSLASLVSLERHKDGINFVRQKTFNILIGCDI